MSIVPRLGVKAVARLRNPEQIRPAGDKFNYAWPAWGEGLSKPQIERSCTAPL
jgi:hypothetical protein